MKSEQITTLRKSLGLTQTDFARLFDAHVMTISKWERGVAAPSPYQISLMQHFQQAANSREKEIKSELSNLIVGAGIVAALIFLLSKSK